MMRSLLPFFLCVVSASLPAQTFLSLGDSVASGVQSGDATAPTQRSAYPVWIARQMGAAFPLPLVQGGLLTTAGSVAGRSRLFPLVRSRNLAVSKAAVDRIFSDQADLIIDDETDLMLFPRVGTQVDIAEQVDADLIVCWLGNNDLLPAVTASSQLDASQGTSIASFDANFTTLAARLAALDANIVYGNIPAVEQIAFAIDRDDLLRLTGSDQNLPAGHFTTLPVALLLRLELADSSILDDPNFVLDPDEVALIEQRRNAFNQIILDRATANGAVVADVASLLAQIDAQPISILGVELSTPFLKGGFSLDGLHPSNLAHALLADLFIATANTAYGLTIPRLSQAQLLAIFLEDPFIDKDGDGRVVGRPFNGLVETISPFVGVSADFNDFSPNATASTADGKAFLEAYRRAAQERPRLGESPQSEGLRAMLRVFAAR